AFGVVQAISLKTGKENIDDYNGLYRTNPKLSLIIVPGEVLTTNNSSFASDHYYSCMGGAGDYVADMARGRISTDNITEATMIVDKIIDYEKAPVQDSSFYQTGLNCAYFQHAGSGYAERRFAQTSEELRTYAVSQGKTVNRVYHASSSVNPTYWNNTYYSNGEPLPSYLKKPNFAWDGDKYDIINHVNNGAFYVFHRDHGYTHGWGDPAFNVNDINSFSNGNKLPVFFSINCLTGKFLEPESFTEKLLRKANGGAVGVFGHAEVSYSGYNDALSLGLFDALWSNPGIIPNFTGSGGISNPSLTPHGDIRQGGHMVNQSLNYMTATWGNSQYTHELFHYFGDPAMEIRVDFPDPILATNTDSISCSSDTAIMVTNINTDSVTATLAVDGQLMGKDILHGTTDTLYFNPVAGNIAILTLSKSGHAPYIDTLDITGGCPKAKIVMGNSMFCVGDSITFSENSYGNITSYNWSFGTSASTVSSTQQGPHTIGYASGGAKMVYLTVSTSNGLTDTDSVSFSIDSICKYTIPPAGQRSITKCNGMLYDDGGEFANYSNNTDGSVTIEPTGASNITLTFSSFHFESGYDYLRIYDGTSTNAPLIGAYDGTSLPGNGAIQVNSNAVTIKQETDQMVTESGFELEWQCSYPNTLPTAKFHATDTNSCTGVVQFFDQSLSGPSIWEWDFGDGITSTQQHPKHQYTSSGTYDVRLKVTNMNGPDSIVKNNYVTINMPSDPSVQADIRCKAGSLTLSANPPSAGNGYLRWFDDPKSTLVLDTGTTYTTPILSTTKTYYVDYAVDQTPEFGAKADYSGGGGYYDHPYEHHLVFDVHEQVKLVSVKVYAGSSGNRNIILRDNNGNPVASKMVNIPAGEHRVNLGFDIPPGTDYELGGPENSDLYRNNSGLNYPYTVSDKITIKESSASSNPTGYYYYFYDWEVQATACRSNRIPVDAIVSDTLKPSTDFSFNNSNDPEIQFSDNSQNATAHFWDFDDGSFSSMPNPTHTYAANGTYQVQLKTTNACGSDSISKPVTINTVAIEELDLSTLSVYPNPATEAVNIDIPVDIQGKKTLQLIDQSGKLIDITSVNENQKKFHYAMDHLAAGTYYLILHTQSETFMAKVILE
ncbi:MAG: C25 family cysteine peptidase, partial [Bacteroidales bacterium]